MGKRRDGDYRVGRYRVAWREIRGCYYGVWYDQGTGGSRSKSLRTADHAEACRTVDEWHYAETRKENKRPRSGPQHPGDVLIATALENYTEDVVAHKPKRERENAIWELQVLNDKLGDWAVCEAVKGRVTAFLRSLQDERGISYNGAVSYAKRLKAALQNEVDNNRLAWFPAFPTAKQKVRRETVLSPQQLATLFDAAVEWPHFFRACLFMATTGCRLEAAVDFTAAQVRWQDSNTELRRSVLDLNPRGREQTRKRRPVLPVTQTLEPWLRVLQHQADDATADALQRGDRAPASPHFVSYQGRRVSGFSTVWRRVKEKALLESSPSYTIRHTVGRALRQRSVPYDQIRGYLGHLDAGETGVYAPWEPEFADAAVDAIDDWLSEVSAHCTRVDLRNPMTLEREADKERARFRARVGHGVRDAAAQRIRFVSADHKQKLK